jgi:L-cysteine desulfidase
MNILKEILRHEVFPALGCTEPIAVAYAASIAAGEIAGSVDQVHIVVDPGVFKNGFAVTVPNTGGEKGNLIAGVLGALIATPALKMEILSAVDPPMLDRARGLIAAGAATMACDRSRKGLFIEATVRSGSDTVRAEIRHSHTHLVLLEKNGRALFSADERGGGGQAYKTALKKMKIADFVALARGLDPDDAKTIRRGIDMNLAISEVGRGQEKVGFYIADLCQKGFIENDIFSSSKILTASAVDARMAGVSYPVMSSGGSGNQGVVAILVPYHVGRHFRVADEKIIESIALSHMINSYIKCFTGELSPLCGCAIASGVGAAAAIVYQQCGGDLEKITLAVNNVISDLGGMLCDGAKGGCALKVASSTDSAIRAAYMAINGHGITHREGFVGKTAEESIQHLSRISRLGMEKADDTMLGIMIEKTNVQR